MNHPAAARAPRCCRDTLRARVSANSHKNRTKTEPQKTAAHTLCFPNVYTLLPPTVWPSGLGKNTTLFRAAKSATCEEYRRETKTACQVRRRGGALCERAETEARASCFLKMSAREGGIYCNLLHKRRLVLQRGCGLLFSSSGNGNGAGCLPANVLPNASGGRCGRWRQSSREVDAVVALQCDE